MRSTVVDQRSNFATAGMKKVGIGIRGRPRRLSILHAGFNDPQSLGSNDPGLSFFQTIQQDGTDQIGIETRHRSRKLIQFVGRRFRLHATGRTQFHNELLFITSVRNRSASTTGSIHHSSRDGNGRRRLMLVGFTGLRCHAGCGRRPAASDSTRSAGSLLGPRIGIAATRLVIGRIVVVVGWGTHGRRSSIRRHGPLAGRLLHQFNAPGGSRILLVEEVSR